MSTLVSKNIIDACAPWGLTPEVVKGSSWFGHNMFAVWHDGVQYSIDSCGRTLKDGMLDIAHDAKHL